MSKISRENKKKASQMGKAKLEAQDGALDNQNQKHNTKKEAMGRNTKR